MATIQSGSGSTLQDVDATSLSARTSEYIQGTTTPLHPSYTGIYSCVVDVVPTTLTSATVYWAIRNLGTKRAFIREINLKLGFTGTAAANRSPFEITRFAGATPTAGTAIVPVKYNNTFAAASVSDSRFAPGGLTVTGVTYEAVWIMVPITSQLTGDVVFSWAETDEQKMLVLATNEGLLIRANNTIISGAYISGNIGWAERT